MNSKPTAKFLEINEAYKNIDDITKAVSQKET